MREKLPIGISVDELMIAMAEGNIGGLSTLLALVREDKMHIVLVLHLDDMNMRGPQIWVAYKYHCDGDLKKFIACLETRDKDMVAKVNQEMLDGGFKWRAVTDGASYMDPRPTFDTVRDEKKLYPAG